ncbi:cytosolic sulfotransferase 15-like [Camellia sinensis]|uniref:cytosolic sulfotransferase 15-like n=1 Tax=Camellia sinensis TaxID=4442 RepID=UPI001035FC33|nr:cytosolic sulfotransferase 15-like [Camellia sinensis]
MSIQQHVKAQDTDLILTMPKSGTTWLKALTFTITNHHYYPDTLFRHTCPTPFAHDQSSRGVVGFEPFWDNVLGYWKESLERPHKVLLLMYEDLKEDIILQMKGVVEFIGVLFSFEEEKKSVIEEILRLCRFHNLREFEVNKTGSVLYFENKTELLGNTYAARIQIQYEAENLLEEYEDFKNQDSEYGEDTTMGDAPGK